MHAILFIIIIIHKEVEEGTSDKKLDIESCFSPFQEVADHAVSRDTDIITPPAVKTSKGKEQC